MPRSTRTFAIGAPVRVARGPFQGETGVVHEFCDDDAYLVVDFGRIKVKILASILVDHVVREPTKPKKPTLRSSHRKAK